MALAYPVKNVHPKRLCMAINASNIVSCLFINSIPDSFQYSNILEVKLIKDPPVECLLTIRLPENYS